MEIVEKKISELMPYQGNPRINDQAVKPVAESIKQFGFKVPIIIDKDNVIVCGHTRLKAAKLLKLKTVPCILADDLTEEQIKAFRLADNKVSDLADWDFTLLENELEGLEDMEAFGFEESDFGEPPENEGLTDEDAIPEEVVPVCKLGQVWQLGEHRVMCGDSTKKEDVEMLMDGKKADMVFTDPPYGVDYHGHNESMYYGGEIKKSSERIKNDKTTDIYENIFQILKKYCIGVGYIFCGAGSERDVLNFMHESKTELISTLVWRKSNGSIALGANYKPVFEMFYYVLLGKNRMWAGNNAEWTVWDIAKNNKNEFHPTQKPIELIIKALKNHTAKTVLDLFLGSGSTLIACEKTNRICYGMELDPHYCDVIINRWEQFTGKKAELILDNE